jgi:serine/threonine protein kinase
VQRAERALHAERMRLAQIAAAHFPELFAMEPLLKLGSVELGDSDDLRRVLVERELSHYDDMKLISATDGRHKVWRASYAVDGALAELCVLKEYNLNDTSEWKALLKEVKLLGQLSECLMTSLMTSLITDDLPHQVKLLGQLSECLFIATVDAVFEVHQPSYAAYVQLPYYNGGNMFRWLNGEVSDQRRGSTWLNYLMPSNRKPRISQRKVLLGQLCEALRHMHSHGLAHGDVKLENVLVSLEGERATAHLADFESARRQPSMGERSSLRASTGGGIAFTELYVAPEILKASKEGREDDAKPTAMGDMFSYGVCCLFACCLPPTKEEQPDAIRHFEVEDDRKLSDWSRDLAKQADAHLPHLLESLLADAKTNAEATSVRLSAKQTLLHPFHDTEAALAASAAANAAATREQRRSKWRRRRAGSARRNWRRSSGGGSWMSRRRRWLRRWRDR